MLIVAAIVYFLLGADAWVWIIPPAVCALVVLKWAVRPADLDESSDIELQE